MIDSRIEISPEAQNYVRERGGNVILVDTPSMSMG
jgi:hypothetical protein